jgi:integrase
VRLGHVKIEVHRYKDGRWGFDDYSLGVRHKVRLLSKQKAIDRANDVTVFLANGRNDLLSIDRAELAEFRRWKLSAKSSRSTKDVAERFLQLKKTKSTRHLESITGDLRLFEKFVGEETPIGTVTAERIQEFLDQRQVGERRKFNLRAAIVSLFRWARRMSYLDDRTTEAEKVEPIERKPGEAHILTPAQMRVLLAKVTPEFLPWLAIAGFAGIRSEEISPDNPKSKSPLLWEDIDWEHKSIIVRAETAKTRQEREVPISDSLAEWLAPGRFSRGPVCPRQPSRHETARLGTFIGGWKHNALRDSFCSYRARITQNIPQVSYEMGNSPAMVKRCYHRRQPIAVAERMVQYTAG